MEIVPILPIHFIHELDTGHLLRSYLKLQNTSHWTLSSFFDYLIFVSGFYYALAGCWKSSLLLLRISCFLINFML
jgi:hypothetical protein